MNNVTLERYWNNPDIRAEIEAAARRDRARALGRFLEQSARALLSERGAKKRPHPVQRAQPCEAC